MNSELPGGGTAPRATQAADSTRAPDPYFDHDADIGVIGRGASVEQALESAARAAFALMVDARRVQPLESVEVAFDEADPELALVEWINALLAAARVKGLALGRFSLAREGDRWTGRAWGERWHAGLERGTEVKGATLTALTVRPRPDGWEARCVVDV